jgi:hypothetical protein
MRLTTHTDSNKEVGEAARAAAPLVRAGATGVRRRLANGGERVRSVRPRDWRRGGAQANAKGCAEGREGESEGESEGGREGG